MLRQRSVIRVPLPPLTPCVQSMPSLKGAFRRVRKLLISQAKFYILYSVGLFIGEWVRHKGMKLFHHKHKHAGERQVSSLEAPGRTFAVVTTAALPWRTGVCATRRVVCCLFLPRGHHSVHSVVDCIVTLASYAAVCGVVARVFATWPCGSRSAGGLGVTQATACSVPAAVKIVTSHKLLL